MVQISQWFKVPNGAEFLMLKIPNGLHGAKFFMGQLKIYFSLKLGSVL
jgi:hypothetical protein